MFRTTENHLPYIDATYGGPDGPILTCAIAKEKSAGKIYAKCIDLLGSNDQNFRQFWEANQLSLKDCEEILKNEYRPLLIHCKAAEKCLLVAQKIVEIFPFSEVMSQGDLCLENKQYTSAIIYYRSVISLIESVKTHVNNFDSNLYWDKINRVESFFTSRITREIVLPSLSHKYKRILNSLRRKVSLMLGSNIQIREICSVVQKEYIALLKEIVDDIMLEIGAPEKEFALLGSG